MAKRPRNSQTAASASADLVKHLTAVAHDVELLQVIIESNDSGSVAAAFAALLTGGSSRSPSSTPPRKAHNRPRPSLSAKAFVGVVLFADRGTLDARLQIPNELYQRTAYLYGFRGWLPNVELAYCHGAGKELVPKTVHQLTSCLRMAFCEIIYIDFEGIDVEYEDTDALVDIYGMVFNDLNADHTFVGTLNMRMSMFMVDLAIRGVEAFKSIETFVVESASNGAPDQDSLNEGFFASAERHGVRHIKTQQKDKSDTPANTAAALSFGFAKPAAGGDRSVVGVVCEIGPDFLAQVKQKVAELDKADDIDFNFKLANVSSQIDSSGFEKYQKGDGRNWLMNDLENHICVKAKQTEKLVEFHVFSST